MIVEDPVRSSAPAATASTRKRLAYVIVYPFFGAIILALLCSRGGYVPSDLAIKMGFGLAVVGIIGGVALAVKVPSAVLTARRPLMRFLPARMLVFAATCPAILWISFAGIAWAFTAV